MLPIKILIIDSTVPKGSAAQVNATTSAEFTCFSARQFVACSMRAQKDLLAQRDLVLLKMGEEGSKLYSADKAFAAIERIAKLGKASATAVVVPSLSFRDLSLPENMQTVRGEYELQKHHNTRPGKAGRACIADVLKHITFPLSFAASADAQQRLYLEFATSGRVIVTNEKRESVIFPREVGKALSALCDGHVWGNERLYNEIRGPSVSGPYNVNVGDIVKTYAWRLNRELGKITDIPGDSVQSLLCVGRVLNPALKIEADRSLFAPARHKPIALAA